MGSVTYTMCEKFCTKIQIESINIAAYKIKEHRLIQLATDIGSATEGDHKERGKD